MSETPENPSAASPTPESGAATDAGAAPVTSGAPETTPAQEGAPEPTAAAQAAPHSAAPHSAAPESATPVTAPAPDTTAHIPPTAPTVTQPGAPGAAFGPAAAAPVAEQAKTRRSPLVGVVAALAVGALIGGVSGAGVSLWAVSQNTSGPASGSDRPTIVTVNDPDDATVVTAVAAKTAPSVVTISVTGQSAAGSGSGVIIDPDGYIVTNNHVVTLDGAVANPEIEVTLHDGRIVDATVVGTDPISDLAVIKLDGVTDLPAAEFADSDKLNVGDIAIAIGAPLGLPGTVTDGIISALNRSITIASSAVPEEPQEEPEQDEPESPFDFWKFDVPGQQTPSTSSTISLSVIQTDAAINHGNSGGALLDDEGNIIGINVAIASPNDSGNIGVGFAIPANLAKRVVQELLENGEATHGLLGASVVNATSDPEFDSDVVGALIKEVTPGGAADAAGIREGDVVTKLGDAPITGSGDLTAQVRALPAGAQTTLTYVRDGKATTVDVTLGALQ